mmetsp:Transcript_90533/g.230301  ORF Transcript_90533/g.230301 Transcript_90533/m.230301 type:complete len:262 (-) Transcript_90533:471-1256(-)
MSKYPSGQEADPDKYSQDQGEADLLLVYRSSHRRDKFRGLSPGGVLFRSRSAVALTLQLRHNSFSDVAELVLLLTCDPLQSALHLCTGHVTEHVVLVPRAEDRTLGSSIQLRGNRTGDLAAHVQADLGLEVPIQNAEQHLYGQEVRDGKDTDARDDQHAQQQREVLRVDFALIHPAGDLLGDVSEIVGLLASELADLLLGLFVQGPREVPELVLVLAGEGAGSFLELATNEPGYVAKLVVVLPSQLVDEEVPKLVAAFLLA